MNGVNKCAEVFPYRYVEAFSIDFKVKIEHKDST